MCGMGGWFASSSGHAGDGGRAVGRMIRALEHRGPDGSGGVIVDGAGLAHTRLAIIDPAGGSQPMWSADRGAVIVMNGEIYNHAALRGELESRGLSFRTRSDTEVVLALWRSEGTRGLVRLRGMYAFAIWDRHLRQGVVARDPHGIKPLFVADGADGTLWFGSEAKAILRASGRDARLDEAALHHLLNLRYLPEPLSLFRGIRQLVPGEVCLWRDGTLRSERIAPVVRVAYPDLGAALADTVRAHLTADVEVGCYLSGGLDSAVVAALAADALPAGPRTFTSPAGDDPDEGRNAAETARVLGLVNAMSERPDAEEPDFACVLHALEVPKVNALQSFELARFTRQHVKVVLSGLGGDELFLGYNAHRILAQAARVARFVPRSLARAASRAGIALLSRLSDTPYTEPERALAMLGAIGDWPIVYGLVRNAWDSPTMRARIYGERMLREELPDTFEWLRAAWPDDRDPVRAMERFEWRHKMVNDLLWHEDRMSMASGLEVRVPFVDGPLRAWVAETARAGPTRARLGKRELRAVAARWLPPPVLARRKSGFQLAPDAFASGALKRYLDRWLDDAIVRDAGLFRPDFARRLRAAGATTSHRWHYFMLFMMAQSHHWIEGFERGGFGAHDAAGPAHRIEIVADRVAP